MGPPIGPKPHKCHLIFREWGSYGSNPGKHRIYRCPKCGNLFMPGGLKYNRP
jgi:uncharacterized C2H2 Zn-finger protein